MEHITDKCILSIDIGTKNLGYSIISWNADIDNPTIDQIKVDFDILTIDDNKKTDIVVKRTNVLLNFFQQISDEYIIEHVVVERQVTTNVVAMCLMYAITSIATMYDAQVIIFDPKRKFSILNVPYTSAKKDHKKQSTQYANNLLSNAFNDKLAKFSRYPKRDDISDAINQGILWGVDNKILNIGLSNIKRLMI